MQIIHFLNQTANKTHIILVIEGNYYLVASSQPQRLDQDINDFINYLQSLISYYNIKTNYHQNLIHRSSFTPINLTPQLEEEIGSLLLNDPNFKPYLTLALIPPTVVEIIKKIINSQIL